MLSGGPLSLTEVLYEGLNEPPLQSRFTPLLGPPKGDIDLFFYNFNVFLPLAEFNQAEAKAGRYQIGYWFWELEALPKSYSPQVNQVDEIWVATRHIAKAMRGLTDRPITVVPTPVQFREPDPAFDRAHFGLPQGRLLFFFNFSAHSSHARKNPWTIFRAFAKAFRGVPEDKRPVVVIKFQGARGFPELFRELQNELNEIKGILLAESLTREEMDGLLNCCDCYISTHRAEGYGLGMIEAMSLGKPVIATDYAGNVDFLDEENGYPVRYEMRKIVADDHTFGAQFNGLYPPGYLWAEPSVEHCAERMREVFDDPAGAKKKGEIARTRLQGYCSKEAVATIAAKRLAEIQLGLKSTAGSPAELSLLPPVPTRQEPVRAKAESERSGVTFIGDWRLDAGLGVARRSMMSACLDAGIPISALIPKKHELQAKNVDPRLEKISHSRGYPINFVAMTPQEELADPAFESSAARQSKYKIANWYWELSSVPLTMREAFQTIDESWAASHFIRESFQSSTRNPVIVIPPPVSISPTGKHGRAHFGLPEGGFVFLASFAATSCTTRKNPWALFAAYERAFPKGPDRPLLVVKAVNTHIFPGVGPRLEERAKEVGATLIDRNLSRAEMEDLLLCADAYISLHRSEGFGLGMAESMMLGKPTIGTAYSGNLDFMTEENSYLVDYNLIPVDQTEFIGDEVFFDTYAGEGAVWADASIESAAAQMRRCYENQDERTAKGLAGKALVERYCSLGAVSQQIVRRLAFIEDSILPNLGVAYVAGASPLARLSLDRRRYVEAWERWQYYRTRDFAYSGRIPFLSGILRLLIRPLYLGKLNDQQDALIKIQRENLDHLASALDLAVREIELLRKRLDDEAK